MTFGVWKAAVTSWCSAETEAVRVCSPAQTSVSAAPQSPPCYSQSSYRGFKVWLLNLQNKEWWFHDVTYYITRKSTILIGCYWDLPSERWEAAVTLPEEGTQICGQLVSPPTGFEGDKVYHRAQISSLQQARGNGVVWMKLNPTAVSQS